MKVEPERAQARKQTDLLEALGGPQGIADSSLPALAFVLTYTLNDNDLSMAAWVAVAAGAVMAGYRIYRPAAPLDLPLASAQNP